MENLHKWTLTTWFCNVSCTYVQMKFIAFAELHFLLLSLKNMKRNMTLIHAFEEKIFPSENGALHLMNHSYSFAARFI